MRGKDQTAQPFSGRLGITPAYAGKSSHGVRRGMLRGDHPRVCGEKKFCFVLHPPAPGSPPRMRGKATIFGSLDPGVRITPAYAGKR